MGKGACAGVHTHTHRLCTTPCQYLSARKCAGTKVTERCKSHWAPREGVGGAQGSLHLPPRGWTPHTPPPPPTKGHSTQDSDSGAHIQVTGLRVGGGGEKTSKQRVMEWREEGHHSPPLPSQRVSVQPNQPTVSLDHRSQAGVPILSPPPPPEQRPGRECRGFFFFSFLNIYIYLYYVYYIYIICKYIFKTI